MFVIEVFQYWGGKGKRYVKQLIDSRYRSCLLPNMYEAGWALFCCLRAKHIFGVFMRQVLGMTASMREQHAVRVLIFILC